MKKLLELLAVGGAVTGLVVGAIVVLAGFVVGVWCLEAWVVDLVYSSILETPDSSAPDISFWQMFGVVAIVNVILGTTVKD